MVRLRYCSGEIRSTSKQQQMDLVFTCRCLLRLESMHSKQQALLSRSMLTRAVDNRRYQYPPANLPHRRMVIVPTTRAERDDLTSLSRLTSQRIFTSTIWRTLTYTYMKYQRDPSIIPILKQFSSCSVGSELDEYVDTTGSRILLFITARPPLSTHVIGGS